MEKTCFVVMPFGGQFDEIYRKIYKPAIQAMGLKPLRADDIYDNRPIIQDIKQSIQNADIILAEVTGRNPNVNYELGIAHALDKEVIIITSNSEDVPSDYRHYRYLQYNSSGIGWDRKLSSDLSATLGTVSARLHIGNGLSHILHPNNGFYEAAILDTYCNKNKGHYFYKLDGLLPLSELKGADSHIPDESHWLADWNRQEPRYKVGEIVRFKVTKVSDLNNWGHVSNARNVNFIN